MPPSAPWRLAGRRVHTHAHPHTRRLLAAAPSLLGCGHGRRRLYSSQPPPPPPPPPRSGSRIKFWPFLAIIALGSAGYVALVNRRKDMPPPTAAAGRADDDKTTIAASSEPLPSPSASAPAFSPDAVTVVFVLGGPGAGKGTQCSRLVAHHGFTHLSAGDLLRAEQDRPGSEFGDLIRHHIRDGLIVPMHVTIQLLQNAMAHALRSQPQHTGRFLIDGFPRKMDQALRFEEAVCPARMVLFYDCPEHVMERRLLERGKTSGRDDDNADSIRKRFRTFVDTSMPVVDYYDKQAKVVKIDATASPDQVFAATQKRLAEKLGSDF